MSRLAVPLVGRRLRYGLVLVVALALLVASVIDPPAGGPSGTVFGLPADKWLHATGYATLAAAGAYAALDGDGLPPRRLLAVLVLAVAYGLAIEGVQAPLSTRSFDLADAAANAAGALVGGLPWLAVEPR